MPPKSKGKKAGKGKTSAVVDGLPKEEMSKDQAKPAKRGSATASFGDLSKIGQPTDTKKT